MWGGAHLSKVWPNPESGFWVEGHSWKLGCPEREGRELALKLGRDGNLVPRPWAARGAFGAHYQAWPPSLKGSCQPLEPLFPLPPRQFNPI